MKSYAKENKAKVIDWNNVLDRKIKGLRVNYTNEQLYKYAGSWVTCACGNQCSVIPRNSWDQPEDQQLARLGAQFFYNIEDQNWEKAKQTLEKIEKRSTILILKIVKEKQKEANLIKEELLTKEKEIKEILS